MESLQASANRALRNLLDHQPTTAAKVLFAWQLAAGPALSRRAIVRWQDDGFVRVSPATDAWLREILRARPLITIRLRELLGPNAIRGLIIDGESDETRRVAKRPAN